MNANRFYRNGEPVNLMYKDGEVIYQNVGHTIPPVSITTNNTYFDIGYIANSNTKVIVEQSISAGTKENTSEVRFWGQNNGFNDSQSMYACYKITTSYIRLYMGGYYNNTVAQVNMGEKCKIELYKTAYNVYDSTGGTIASANISTNMSNSATVPFKIGKTDENSDNGIPITTFYSFKIYEGNNLIYDLIPWFSEGHGCLKNTLTGTIYQANNPSAVTANYE